MQEELLQLICDMHVSGTHFNYFHVCKRKLWLFANGISMEHTSDIVLEGRLIHEDSYSWRSERYVEIELDGIKVDYYDPRTKVIHEVKKSNIVEAAHEWQLKYYLFVFEKNGIEGVSGVLEYPLLKKKKDVILRDVDREEIETAEKQIKEIVSSVDCPVGEKRGICKNCSYYEFCFCGDE